MIIFSLFESKFRPLPTLILASAKSFSSTHRYIRETAAICTVVQIVLPFTSFSHFIPPLRSYPFIIE